MKISQSIKQSAHKHILPILALVMIAAAAYLTFYAPILYNDDWSYMLGRWYYGNSDIFDLMELRPLERLPPILLYNTVGLNLLVYYLSLWLWEVLAAILFYFLMLRFMPNSQPIAFSMAALVLIYPADFSKMWMTMNHIWLGVVMTLIYAHLLLTYANSGKKLALWISQGALIFAFGLYEGHFGIAMAWGVLLILMNWSTFLKARLGLMLPFVVGAAFLLWRTVVYPMLGVALTHHYFGLIDFTPIELLIRLIMGYRIMIWAWVEPFIFAFGLNTITSLLLLLFTITVCVVGGYRLARILQLRQNPDTSEQQFLDNVRQFMLMIGLGAVFIAAGYLPFIPLFTPSMFPLGSRYNLFAIFGASVACISLFSLVTLIFRRRTTHLNIIVMAAATPLILLGTLVQMQVQYDHRLAWEDQKQIWQQLFILAPDFKDGTSVYFLIIDYETRQPSLNRNAVRLPVRGSWDVSTALNMLYGKYTLRGDRTSPELFLKDGIRDFYFTNVTPYDQVVVFIYDRNSKLLRIVEDLAAENLVEFPAQGYEPAMHILQTPTTQTQYRGLVGIAEVQ